MKYEHNHSIQFDLDHLSQYEDVIELEEKKIELDEVYAKAQAFDEYVKHNAEYGKTYYEITRDHIAQEMGILLEKHESKG